jgi:hypothetical protein
MYRARITFRDLQDGHLYQSGDPFPHDGREIKPERIESLLNGQNAANMALIEEVDIYTTEDDKAVKKPVKRRKTGK